MPMIPGTLRFATALAVGALLLTTPGGPQGEMPPVVDLGAFEGVRVVGRTARDAERECVLLGMRNDREEPVRVSFALRAVETSGSGRSRRGRVELRAGEFKGGGIPRGDDPALALCGAKGLLAQWEVSGVEVRAIPRFPFPGWR